MNNHSFPLGLALAAVGGAMLSLTGTIQPLRLADNGDPGPRLFPALLAGALLLAGVVEAALGLRAFLRARRADAPAVPALLQRTFPIALLVWSLSLAVYLAALPWLGFALATLLLVGGLLLWQGTRWWIATTVACSLVGVVYAMFGLAFKVPLPRGLFGM